MKNKLISLCVMLFAIAGVNAQQYWDQTTATPSTSLTRSGDMTVYGIHTFSIKESSGMYPLSNVSINNSEISLSRGVPAAAPYTVIRTGYFVFSAYENSVQRSFVFSSGVLTSNAISNNFTNYVKIGSNINTPSGYKLYVEDGILTEKVKVAVANSTDWADFVFEPTYKLTSIYDVEKYISVNKHLPGVPSASEVVESGLDVAKTDAMLLQKIEELTLYIIDLQKQIDELKDAK